MSCVISVVHIMLLLFFAMFIILSIFLFSRIMKINEMHLDCKHDCRVIACIFIPVFQYSECIVIIIVHTCNCYDTSAAQTLCIHYWEGPYWYTVREQF